MLSNNEWTLAVACRRAARMCEVVLSQSKDPVLLSWAQTTLETCEQALKETGAEEKK